jgi:GH25 family lysozyme M1 (1,4-beta-N-acetylmuramidase)
MAIFGWDCSHFDGTLSLATMKKAKAEGIAFVTHKLGEGANHTLDDGTQATALAAARDAGIQVIGGYWFGHGEDDPVAEADLCIAVADAREPWWRTFPHWFWQPDCETEPGHTKPSKTWIAAFAGRLESKTNRRAVVYASHGQYANTLSGLAHPLWNANYPSNKQAGFAALYPGDHYTGWAAYSGQTPIICQYTSSATIAGHTTCDANAFRGTLADLQQTVGAPVTTLTDNDGNALIWRVEGMAQMLTAVAGGVVKGEKIPLVTAILGIEATLAGMVKTEAAIQAAVAAISSGQVSDANMATLTAQIKAVGDAESAAVTALRTQLAAAQAELATLKADLVAAAQAEATALAK